MYKENSNKIDATQTKYLLLLAPLLLLVLLIASLAAAQSVKTIGNKESINKTQIVKSLQSIIK